MPREVSLEEDIASEIVAPMILRILKPFSAQDMSYAITHSVNLAKTLMEDPDYLNYLRGLVAIFPFADRAAPKIRSKRWIIWFLNNELQHERADLYTQIVYAPGGVAYIVRQIRAIVKLVFG